MFAIRNFQKGDETQLREIFFNTIRNVNIKDYSEQQVKAWAPEDYDILEWCNRMTKMNPFIAVLDEQIVGYADIQNDGYIDHFYCHWKFQGKGVGKTLMQSIFRFGQQNEISRLYSQVSITANPFFEHFGFKVVKEQQVEIRGHVLNNYIMEKISVNLQ